MSPLTVIRFVQLLPSAKTGGCRFKKITDLPYLSEPSTGLELERNFVWRA